MASIRRRGKSWQADVLVGARRIRRSFKSETQAKEWADRMESQGGEPAEVVTLEDALMHLYNTRWVRSEGSGGYRSTMRLLMDAFGRNTKLRDITQVQIERFVASEYSRGLKPGSINKRLGALSLALRVDREGTRDLKIPYQKTQESRLVWLSEDDEAQALRHLQYLKQEDVRAFVIVLIDTGMRPKEALRMRWAQIDLDDRAIHVEQTKTKKVRVIPMTDRVHRTLAARRQHEVGEGPFLGALTYNQVEHQWGRVRWALGWDQDIQRSLYVLRHTFASRLVQKGVDLPVVSYLMGHATFQQTLRYAHLSNPQKVEAIRRLER